MINRVAKWRPRMLLAVGLLVWLVTHPSDADLTGGNFRLSGEFAGGGGISSGGWFNLAGAVRSAGAGTSSGGEFQIRCGIMGVVVIPNPEVTLTVEQTADGQARLSWPATATDYKLEFALELGPNAQWLPVIPTPLENLYITPLNQPARFFRLHRP